MAKRTDDDGCLVFSSPGVGTNPVMPNERTAGVKRTRRRSIKVWILYETYWLKNLEWREPGPVNQGSLTARVPDLETLTTYDFKLFLRDVTETCSDQKIFIRQVIVL